jgi:hypothetical protein
MINLVFIIIFALFINNIYWYNTINETIINILFNILDIYSLVIIFINKNIIKIFNNNYNNKYYKLVKNLYNKCLTKNNIIFISNGKEILKYKNKKSIIGNDIKEYDFILFYQQKIDGYYIFFNINDIPYKSVLFNNKYTNVVFLASNLKIKLVDNTECSIDLKIKQYLYNGNIILSKEFIKWYLFKYHSNIKINYSILSYNIYLLDSNINQIILDKKDAMMINLDKFTIIKR